MREGDDSFEADSGGIMELDLQVPVELGEIPNTGPPTLGDRLKLAFRRFINFSWMTLIMGVLLPVPAIIVSAWSVHAATTYDGDNIYGGSTNLVPSGLVTIVYYAVVTAMYYRIRSSTASIGAATLLTQGARLAIFVVAVALWFGLSLRGPERHSSRPMAVAYFLFNVALVLSSALSLFLVRYFNYKARMGSSPRIFGAVSESVFMDVADNLTPDEDSDLQYELEQLGAPREVSVPERTEKDRSGEYSSVPLGDTPTGDDDSDDEEGGGLGLGEAQVEIEESEDEALPEKRQRPAERNESASPQASPSAAETTGTTAQPLAPEGEIDYGAII